mmetsp:Transcript_8380/g.27311  ORF Transcript_8380/g.27311 Transcript_8380/m.27311 type:complete len:312 (+) Transcript_8380:37-972(+)
MGESVRSNPREVLKGPLARAEKGGAKIAREDELARLRPRQRHNPASEQQGPCLELRRHALAREAVAQLRQPQRARRHQRGAPARRPRRGSRRRKRGGSGVERRRAGGPATTTGVRDCRGGGGGGCRGRRLQHSGDAAAQVSRLAQEAGGVREVVCGDARELEAGEELVVELEPVRRRVRRNVDPLAVRGDGRRQRPSDRRARLEVRLHLLGRVALHTEQHRARGSEPRQHGTQGAAVGAAAKVEQLDAAAHAHLLRHLDRAVHPLVLLLLLIAHALEGHELLDLLLAHLILRGLRLLVVVRTANQPERVSH